MMIHCTGDSLVSYHHSERLYKKANNPKQLWAIEGCGHLRVFTENRFEEEYREKRVRLIVAIGL